LTSLIVAANRPPGQPDASITPDGAKEARKREQKWKEWDEDDIPLGQLRRYRPQQQGAYTLERGNMVPYPAGEPSLGTTLDFSPSPLAIGPLVPKTAADAGLEEEGLGIGTAIEEEDDGDDERLLPSNGHPGVRHEERKSLFAKNSSGGHRWCSKCDAWKPDRCHHCRSCRRCTLKSKLSISRELDSQAK
jgi:palmitoyltransferase